MIGQLKNQNKIHFMLSHCALIVEYGLTNFHKNRIFECNPFVKNFIFRKEK